MENGVTPKNFHEIVLLGLSKKNIDTLICLPSIYLNKGVEKPRIKISYRISREWGKVFKVQDRSAVLKGSSRRSE